MKTALAIIPFIATAALAVDRVLSEGGISFTYDDVTFPESKVEKSKKLTLPEVGNGTPFDVGPGHYIFHLRDKRPLPALDQGPRYMTSSQSRVEIVPLFDETEKDFVKAYGNLRDTSRRLGRFLDRAPKRVPWLPGTMDLDERQRVSIPDIVCYNSSPAYQVKLRYFENERMRGVFFLSQYTQEWPVWPNHEQTAYFFHGLSNDGRYAIVAEFAFTHPSIPKGIDFVPERAKKLKVSEAEVQAEVNKLAAQKDETFTPTLPELRKVVGSLRLPEAPGKK